MDTLASSPPSTTTTQPHARRIYTLHGYPPEVIAVAFAKTSRVPDSFDQIARELNEEQSSKFHEKWVIGYGHASVAEHAVLSIALENVSILATKVIEDNRLSSFTEQSTRYQVYGRDRFFRPPALMAAAHAERYIATCEALMGAYSEWVEPMMAHLAPQIERTEKMTEKLWLNRVRAAACDVVRYLLPASTQTNLGWTVNARVLEHAITKLRSHPLEEMRAIGEEIRAVVAERVPTLLKYAEPSEYLRTRQNLTPLPPFPTGEGGNTEERNKGPNLDDQWDVKLIHWDADAEERVVAALLYERTAHSYAQVLERVRAMSEAERGQILSEAADSRSKYEQVTRAWETTSYTFDVLIDYGAFRDLQRHRMATQINQPVTPLHGHIVPPEIDASGLGDEFRRLMDLARVTHAEIAADFAEEAQYVVPLACRKRTLFTMNLRELHHLIQLRSGPMGHQSYRMLANHLWDAVQAVHPRLAGQIRVTKME